MKKFVLSLVLFVGITNLFANNDTMLDEFETEFENSYVEVYDPFSGYNKAMTSFNDSFYRNVAFPVARGYKNIVPKPARTGI